MLCTHECYSLRFEASAEPPQKYREIKYHAIDRHTGKKEKKKSFTTWTRMLRLRVFNPFDYFVECWNAKNFAASLLLWSYRWIKNPKMSDDNFEFILFLEFFLEKKNGLEK